MRRHFVDTIYILFLFWATKLRTQCERGPAVTVTIKVVEIHPAGPWEFTWTCGSTRASTCGQTL